MSSNSPPHGLAIFSQSAERTQAPFVTSEDTDDAIQIKTQREAVAEVEEMEMQLAAAKSRLKAAERARPLQVTNHYSQDASSGTTNIDYTTYLPGTRGISELVAIRREAAAVEQAKTRLEDASYAAAAALTSIPLQSLPEPGSDAPKKKDANPPSMIKSQAYGSAVSRAAWPGLPAKIIVHWGTEAIKDYSTKFVHLGIQPELIVELDSQACKTRDLFWNNPDILGWRTFRRLMVRFFDLANNIFEVFGLPLGIQCDQDLEKSYYNFRITLKVPQIPDEMRARIAQLHAEHGDNHELTKEFIRKRTDQW